MSDSIKIELSSASINSAIKKLKNYKSDMNNKVEHFVKILAEKGVSSAESAPIATDNGETYNSLIQFSAESEKQGECSAKGKVLAEERSKVTREWYKGGMLQTAEVSPLMMAEFGSGVYAESETMASGAKYGGRGTFPNQTHAFEEGWSWEDIDTGEKKHSKGVIASQPMSKASEEVKANVKDAAKEAFSRK